MHARALPPPLGSRTRIDFASSLASLPPTQAVAYANLLRDIVEDSAVDPSYAFNIIFEICRKTSLTSSGDWKFGEFLLSTCRTALLRHPTVTLYKPLGELLLFVSLHYADLDIRDRANFYFNLLTHVQQSKIKLILTEQNSQAAGFLSPSVAPDTRKQPRKVLKLPQFLRLRRSAQPQPQPQPPAAAQLPEFLSSGNFATEYRAFLRGGGCRTTIRICCELLYDVALASVTTASTTTPGAPHSV
eukprot:TRINITY_DN32_c0_g1_i2.p1 TRINITY_DN32_c0_g1~~TRINITY_DN32_c0_g1_i2.p1  ORF type:complete len:244 (-),score=56.47 TRINITY_DN32_c0_g1_i2:86-817(-)